MRIAIFITAIVLFASGVFLSYVDKAGGATVTYTAAVLCLVFAFLQEFKKFKGFGIEAELLEKKIAEADKILNQLRSLIKPISELLFTMVARGGRWDSAIPKRDSYRLMTQFTTELKALGIGDNEIIEAQKDWHQFNLIDLSRPIIESINNLLQEKNKVQQEVTRAFKQPITPEDQPAHKKSHEESQRIAAQQKELQSIYSLDDRHLAYDRIIDFLNSCYLISESERDKIISENEAQLKDLKHYTDKHEFRRLDVWFNEKD